MTQCIIYLCLHHVNNRCSINKWPYRQLPTSISMQRVNLELTRLKWCCNMSDLVISLHIHSQFSFFRSLLELRKLGSLISKIYNTKVIVHATISVFNHKEMFLPLWTIVNFGKLWFTKVCHGIIMVILLGNWSAAVLNNLFQKIFWDKKS